MYWTPAEHLIQLSCMAVIIFSAQAITRRAHERRQRAETERLRSILTLGLSSLSKTYQVDLDLLPHPPRRLVAGRHQMNLLRLHLGRITSLETAEAEAVMSACIAAERAEAWLEIAGKPMGGAAAAIERRDELKASLRSTLVEAIDHLQRAVASLDPNAELRGRTSAASEPPEAAASVVHQPRNPAQGAAEGSFAGSIRPAAGVATR